MSKHIWDWSTAKLVAPQVPSPKQLWFQERYGDELTKAIKVARHNIRKENYLCGLETQTGP